MTTKKTAKKTTAKSGKAAKPPVSLPEGAQILQSLQKELGKQSFANASEVQAFMKSLMGLAGQSLGEPGGPESLKDEAQDLAFEAMEATTAAQARKFAKQALAKDPDCVDALVVLSDLDSGSNKEAIEGLQKAVEAGERSLGAKFIEQNKGHFWMLLDTRPYMRALEHLARAFRAAELNREAIKVYEKMLALNPGDNQGVRDPLLGLYLALGDTEGAAKLLKAYKDDGMANFAWGRTLERFLRQDLPGAEAALKIARKQNRFVELFLSGQKKFPKQMPNSYASGSEDEALICLDNLAEAWGNSQPASAWLMEQLAKGTAPKKAAEAKVVRIKPTTPA